LVSIDIVQIDPTARLSDYMVLLWEGIWTTLDSLHVVSRAPPPSPVHTTAFIDQVVPTMAPLF
jgi:hypothetical protein